MTPEHPPGDRPRRTPERSEQVAVELAALEASAPPPDANHGRPHLGVGDEGGEERGTDREQGRRARGWRP